MRIQSYRQHQKMFFFCAVIHILISLNVYGSSSWTLTKRLLIKLS